METTWHTHVTLATKGDTQHHVLFSDFAVCEIGSFSLMEKKGGEGGGEEREGHTYT